MTTSLLEEIYINNNAKYDPTYEIPIIESINNTSTQTTIAKIGQDGVTKISAYAESGEMSYVPWLAVYKGDFLWQRVDVEG